MKNLNIELKVNGVSRTVEVSPAETLLNVLRDKLGAVEVKNGCGEGDCGACTVLVDGTPMNSCLILAVQADGREITTIKGLGDEDHPHPVQLSFVEKGAIQCGYCTPGMVISAKALLDRNPEPDRAEIRKAISGNFCRCTGFQKIVDAVEDAAQKMKAAQE